MIVKAEAGAGGPMTGPNVLSTAATGPTGMEAKVVTVTTGTTGAVVEGALPSSLDRSDHGGRIGDSDLVS